MSDVVGRLENCEPAFYESSNKFNRELNELVGEAIDEIERLRARVAELEKREKKLRKSLDGLIDGFERSIDTRRCAVGALRKLNTARAALAETAP